MTNPTPRAWMREWHGDESDLGSYIFAENEGEKDDEPDWAPLYDQATLDAAIAAERSKWDAFIESEMWSFVRSVMCQGVSINQDYATGKHETYEHYSARLDVAASERANEFAAAIRARSKP